MTDKEERLHQSARLMRILGWLLVVGLISMVFIYPPGFMWGAQPEGFPHIGPAHPPSPYDGLHPYLYMLLALYVAYGILLIRGARDPCRNVALFDFGILSSVSRSCDGAPVLLLPERTRPPVGGRSGALRDGYPDVDLVPGTQRPSLAMGRSTV